MSCPSAERALIVARYAAGASTHELSRSTGWSAPVIARWVRAAGLSLRPRGPVQTGQAGAIRALLDAGVPRPEIVRALGVSRQRVHQVAKSRAPESTRGAAELAAIAAQVAAALEYARSCAAILAAASPSAAGVLSKIEEAAATLATAVT